MKHVLSQVIINRSLVFIIIVVISKTTVSDCKQRFVVSKEVYGVE